MMPSMVVDSSPDELRELIAAVVCKDHGFEWAHFGGCPECQKTHTVLPMVKLADVHAAYDLGYKHGQQDVAGHLLRVAEEIRGKS